MITLGRNFSLSDAEIKCAVYGYGDYKKTYKAYLEQLKKKMDTLNSNTSEYGKTTYEYSFYLYDITGDCVPELLVKKIMTFDGINGAYSIPSLSILTIKDDRLICAMSSELTVYDGGKFWSMCLGWNESVKQMVVRTELDNVTEYQYIGGDSNNRVFRKYLAGIDSTGGTKQYYYSKSNTSHYYDAIISKAMFNNIAKAYNKFSFEDLGDGYTLDTDKINRALK